MTTKKVREAKSILADIVVAKTAYSALMQRRSEVTIKEQDDLVAELKALSKELDESLTTGAVNCKNCDAKPMGMLKTPAYTTPQGVDVDAVYEVGCVFCPPQLVERENGKALLVDGTRVVVKRRSYSARATSAAETVRKWNEGEWVEDFLFDRIPDFTPIEAEENE